MEATVLRGLAQRTLWLRKRGVRQGKVGADALDFLRDEHKKGG